MWNAEEEERSDHCGLLQATNDMLQQDEFIQAEIVYNIKCGSLFFFFISLDFFIQILHRAISVFWPKYGMYPGTTPLIFFLREPCEPWKPATVLRTVRSNRGFMFFSHREVLSSKRTVIIGGSRLIQVDRMVQFGFENYAQRKYSVNFHHCSYQIGIKACKRWPQSPNLLVHLWA